MKIVANKESYGFQGKLWKKGDSEEVSEGEKFPKEHFDIVGDFKDEEVKAPHVKPETKKKH